MYLPGELVARIYAAGLDWGRKGQPGNLNISGLARDAIEREVSRVEREARAWAAWAL